MALTLLPAPGKGKPVAIGKAQQLAGAAGDAVGTKAAGTAHHVGADFEVGRDRRLPVRARGQFEVPEEQRHFNARR